MASTARSLEQVASEQGIVAERVRQLEKRAIAKLRQLSSSYLQGWNEEHRSGVVGSLGARHKPLTPLATPAHPATPTSRSRFPPLP